MNDFIILIPILWDLIGLKKNGAINITAENNEVIVSIWCGIRWRRFKNKTTSQLISEIRKTYEV